MAGIDGPGPGPGPGTGPANARDVRQRRVIALTVTAKSCATVERVEIGN